MLARELRDLLPSILPFTGFGTYPPFRTACFSHHKVLEWNEPSVITQHICAKQLRFLSHLDRGPHLSIPIKLIFTHCEAAKTEVPS